MNLNDFPQLPLENIFDKLPEKNLLTVALVSKNFHQAFVPVYARHMQNIFEQMQEMLVADGTARVLNKLTLQPALRRVAANRMLTEAKINPEQPLEKIEAKLCSLYLQRKFKDSIDNFTPPFQP